MEHLKTTIGLNVVNILYPVRPRNASKKIILNESNDQVWEHIYIKQDNPPSEGRFAENFYPSISKIINKPYGATKEINDVFLFKYFLPSIQTVLFDKKSKFSTYRLKDEPKQLKGELSEGNSEVYFDWLATELYKFSDSFGILVARVALVPSSRSKELSFNDWMTFVNRIRQNHNKYEGAPEIRMTAASKNIETAHKNSMFFNMVSEIVEKEDLVISSRAIDFTDRNTYQNYKSNPYQYIEPDNFVHAAVQTTNKLKPEQLYQLTGVYESIDFLLDEKKDMVSPEYVNEHLNAALYKRWGSTGNYFSGSDAASMAVFPIKTPPSYYDSTSDNFMADLFIQHYSKHYLFLILLQLYYREELQRIMGEYSELGNLQKNISKAQQLLKSFYYLNQTYYFNKISNEIQGIELWEMYHNVLGIKDLYRSVREDMMELNQRLIELGGERQTNETRTLTVLAFFTGMLGINVLIKDKASDISTYLQNFASPPLSDKQVNHATNIISDVTLVLSVALFIYMLLNVWYLAPIFIEAVKNIIKGFKIIIFFVRKMSRSLINFLKGKRRVRSQVRSSKKDKISA